MACAGRAGRTVVEGPVIAKVEKVRSLGCAVAVLGGAGNFGARILRALRGEAADTRLAEVQTCLGSIQLFLEWDWAAAESHFRRATQLDPAYAQGHRMLAVALTHRGRHDEARTAIRRARELDVYATWGRQQ